MWKSLFKREPFTPPPPDEPAAPAIPFGERMAGELEQLRWTARRAGGTLPVAALPRLGEIEDVLVPLIEYLIEHPPSVDEEIAVEAMVTDYLPTTLRAYIGMNRQIAETKRADGRTAGDDLLDQLATLKDAVHELSQSVYAHDAEQLATQGRFLTTKFSRSDLAL
ncbi:MAG: hypothetical protein QOH38_1478 [Thermoleophilaceae bacterium]|jgi:hypothetical protein|nr:hypothetical protein [Thermoleophilaceae bacterium]